MEDKKNGLSKGLSSSLGNLKNYTMVFVLVGVMILFQILIVATGRGSLFAPANITNIIKQNAYVAILAAGMLCCILTGGNIDLSVGSIVALVGAMAGVFVVNLGLNIYLSIILCLIIGIMIGAAHGFFIAYLHIPPFITTLAGMLLWRGIATIILDGRPISPFPENYRRLFESFIPGQLTGKMGTFQMWGGEVDTYAFLLTMIICLVLVALYIIAEVVGRIKKIRNNICIL